MAESESLARSNTTDASSKLRVTANPRTGARVHGRSRFAHSHDTSTHTRLAQRRAQRASEAASRRDACPLFQSSLAARSSSSSVHGTVDNVAGARMSGGTSDCAVDGRQGAFPPTSLLQALLPPLLACAGFTCVPFDAVRQPRGTGGRHRLQLATSLSSTGLSTPSTHALSPAVASQAPPPLLRDKAKRSLSFPGAGGAGGGGGAVGLSSSSSEAPHSPPAGPTIPFPSSHARRTTSQADSSFSLLPLHLVLRLHEEAKRISASSLSRSTDMPRASAPPGPIFILIPTLVLIPPTPPPPATPRAIVRSDRDSDEAGFVDAKSVEWPFRGLILLREDKDGLAGEVKVELIASVDDTRSQASVKTVRQAHTVKSSRRTRGWRRRSETKDKHAQLVRVDRKIELGMQALGF